MNAVMDIDKLKQLKWFHSFDFGNGVTVEGYKALKVVKREAESYFGNLDIKGASVLDIGTWSGYNAFDAERRGAARVVGSDHYVWNSRPKGREPFDVAHALLNSSVEALDIDVPDIKPETIGTFNIVLFLGVFYHLYDAPTLTKQIAQCASDILILETHQDALDNPRPAMVFYPGKTLGNDSTNWWGPNPQCVYEILRECGFSHIFYQDSPSRDPKTLGPCYRGRGIYHAFRNEAALARFKTGDADWSDLSKPEVREEIFAAAELELARAPRIVGSGTKIGKYRGGVEKFNGVNLIAPCCHDTASAVAGIPAAQENWAYISSGTWSLIGTVLAEPCRNAEAARENFTNLGAAGGRVLFHKGIAGMWLLRQCMTAWQTEDIEGIVKEASAVQPFGADEWIDVEDPELSLPGDMPARIHAQRVRRGLPVVDGIPEMARLIFDSLAGRYAIVLRSLEQITGKKLEEVYVVGGGSQNELLNRLTAEATGLKVTRGAVESSTIGNFAVQLAAGEDDTSAENVTRWARMLSS